MAEVTNWVKWLEIIAVAHYLRGAVRNLGQSKPNCNLAASDISLGSQGGSNTTST